MIRVGMAALTAVAFFSPVAATAQSVDPAVRQIECALGDCNGKQAAPAAAAADDGSIVVGDERSFSLAGIGSGARSAPAASAAPGAHGAPAKRQQFAAVRKPAAARLAPAERKADMMLSFDNGSAELTADAAARVQLFAQALKGAVLSDARFAIEGHTNSVGNPSANKTLSERRAQTVVDYLVSQGVDPSRIVARGLGDARPIQGVAGADPRNRRVEIVRTL